ncbi:hypothetical protein ACVWYN_002704 [Pedobacter sp. UYP24]
MKNLLILAFKLSGGLAASFCMGATLAYTAGASDFYVALIGALFAAFSLMPKGINLTGTLATITVTDLVTEYGAFYKAGSQSLKDLRKKIFQPSVTEAFFTNRLTDSTRLELANATITRVLQAFQSAFTPLGDTTFTPQPIILDHLKIDADIIPHDLMETWLGFLALNGLKPADCPIVKYWLEELVIPQYWEDLEKYEIWNGKKLAIIPGTPSVASAAMNGIKEKLKGPGINIVTMGAAPTDPVQFVEYLEDYTGNIPELIRDKMDAHAMSTTLGLRFRQGMRAKYNLHYAQEADLMKMADFDIKIQALPSMVGHTSIWSTIPENRIVANKNPKNQGVFDVQVSKRQVLALTDFHKGIGFWNNGLIYRTDVALT